ncbi:hypothetical protein KXV70_005035 [Aspergillus fumigatus]|nr:hypothetical protein KXX66_001693 [Aspergillus fumigatus]KAH1406202.1 hypothetical protein KXX22_001246 [Aspergillus fumigatus]KAH1844659.1 hypothetical protein KXX55_002652 [Aspergillus fumigatus]KAH2567801.1 hypothetical protein KXV70_005035 [Aspergillus fumigatus]
MSPTSVSDSHPAVLSLRTAALVTSAAGFISLAWSITHHKDISDDGAGGINSIVLGTIAYAFLWSLVALTIRLTPRRIHPGIYLAFDLIAFLANVIAGSIGLAVLAPAMEGGPKATPSASVEREPSPSPPPPLLLLLLRQPRRTLLLDPRKNIRQRGNHLWHESQHHADSQGPRDRIQLRLLRAQRSKTIEDSDTDEDEREGDGYNSRARKRGIPSPARNKREHSLDNQDPPRDCQNGNTLLGDLRGLVEGLLVFLEFYRAGGCEGHACDDEHVRSADDAQGAEEEEEEPSQKTIASMSYEEVEDWDGEDCVDGAGSGREGVGHCASRFRQMYILRAIYLAEESAKSGRQRQ